MKYRVHLCETIGAYCQEEWHEDYKSRKKALERIKEVNDNMCMAGEWFIQAREQIEEIK